MIRVELNMGGEKRDIRHFNYYYFKPHRINKTFYRKFLQKNFPFEREDKDDLFPYDDHQIPTASQPLSRLDEDLIYHARMFYDEDKEKYYQQLTRLRYQNKLDFGIIDWGVGDLDMMPRYSDIKEHCMESRESVGGLFSFSLESTDDDDFFYDWFFWGECLKGEFRFFIKMEEIPDFKIEFEEAYAVDLEERYTAEGSDPMMLRMRITPAIVRNRGIIHEKSWKSKKIPFEILSLLLKKEQAATEENEPEIVFVQWKDSEGSVIEEIPENLIVSLYAETEGCSEGDEASFYLTFGEDNEKEVEIKCKVGKGGVIEEKDIDLAALWEEQQTENNNQKEEE